MTAKHDCSAGIWHRTAWYPCSRPATVQRDDKWYCWQHDPEYVAKKAAERQAAWKAKMDREAAKYKRIARNAKLSTLVTEETAALLEYLAAESQELMLEHGYDVGGRQEQAEQAYKLAACIREALDLHKQAGASDD